ncbi:putative serine/threonine-protein kinase pim-2-like [Triplophysa rosa]|uniref:non-specific serine/threonine protein kinase n=2 Tax=Triplophysa rosa TaxID=992332 RepID=A0A9W7T456_TRIRA|nr:putative serine/threonine-protein kinase pim-2-like [Triplophysa rosa]
MKWRATKTTFSRSDPDPSDPQPGPSEQTRLSVFKTSVLQDPVDVLPGCCNREQTPPEDQADHQQVPSGLDPTAPTTMAEQQTTENKKKGVRAGLKKRWQAIKSTFSRFRTADPQSGLEPTKPADSQSSRTLASLYEVGIRITNHRLIYEGTRRSDGLKVAIKFVPKGSRFDTYINIPGYDKPLLKEVALNLLLHKPEKCPNIVQMLDWFEEENQHILILDYPFPSVSFGEFINKNVLSEHQFRDLMRQVVTAVKHLIDHNVYNRLWSLLINTDTMELKVSEFGEGLGDLILNSFKHPERYWQAFNAARLVGCLGRVLHVMIRRGCLDGVPEEFAKECRYVSIRWFYLSRYYREPLDLRSILDIYRW